jgi:hypothetical protein
LLGSYFIVNCEGFEVRSLVISHWSLGGRLCKIKWHGSMDSWLLVIGEGG